MVPSLKYPSAFLPIVLSTAALAFLLGYVAIFGVVNEPVHDERTPARIFQLLMLAQGILAAFFVLRWLPRAPRQTLQILALQVIAALVPMAIVIFLER